MDALTADQTLTILEQRHYSGVVSAHSWDSPQENRPIYQLGGFVTPIAGSSPQFVLGLERRPGDPEQALLLRRSATAPT